MAGYIDRSPDTCHFSPVTGHLSPVTCHPSPVTVHLSPVTCHLSPVTCHWSWAMSQRSWKLPHSPRASTGFCYRWCPWMMSGTRASMDPCQYVTSRKKSRNYHNHTWYSWLSAIICQICTSTRNTSIPPGVLSFQVVFVNKFNLMEDILLKLLWPVR